MSIRLHIDRVVLEGIDVAAADRGQLHAALQSELTRLIGERGLAPELAGGIAVPSVRAPQIELGATSKPAQIGTAIAGAVAGGVGGKR
jgi:hypothetical protein